MKLAILQPYLFPYLPYYQLIAAVDRVVMYDDVAFIKQGWIHRNRILGRPGATWLTVPVRDRSSFRRILDTEVAVDDRPRWESRLLRNVRSVYARSPCFAAVFPLVERVLTLPTPRVGEMARESVRAVTEYLGVDTPVRDSSRDYGNAELEGQARVLDICRREGAGVYVNPAGGRELYSSADFAAAGVELRFLVGREVRYRQFDDPFVPGLSMIDVLMFNPRDRVLELLGECELA